MQMSITFMKGEFYTYKDRRNLFLKPVGDVSLEVFESLSFFAENAPELKEFLYIDLSECGSLNETVKGLFYKFALHASGKNLKVTFANPQKKLVRELEESGLKGIADFKEMDLSMIPWENGKYI